LEAPWQPSRHTVPPATRFKWWGDDSCWSACGRSPRVRSPTHLPPYHRRQARADPLPNTRVPGWPRQRAVVFHRWRGCSRCSPDMLVFHETSLSGERKKYSQFKKKTRSTLPRDVLARPSNSHPRQLLWCHAICAPACFVHGTALTMQGSHLERQMWYNESQSRRRGRRYRPSSPLVRQPLWDSSSRKPGRPKRHDKQARFSCWRRRCLSPSSPIVVKARKPLRGDRRH